jgi:hypothetical protein
MNSTIDARNFAAEAAAAPGETERHAYNFAFDEMGLCWHWDEKTYSELRGLGSERERLRSYLERKHSHLLKAYDAEFLVDAISATKSRVAAQMSGQY